MENWNVMRPILLVILVLVGPVAAKTKLRSAPAPVSSAPIAVRTSTKKEDETYWERMVLDTMSMGNKPTKPSPKPTNKPTPKRTPPPTPRLMPPPVELASGNTFPAVNGQSENMKSQGGVDPENAMCGAIESVLTLPSDPNICFAGSVNGGVWRTFNCMDSSPVWVPLTDGEESLSVGDMVFDESDPTGNTILVGIGRRSSFYQIGGRAIGLLYTQNALSEEPTWTVLDNQDPFNDDTISFRDTVQFRSVFARGSLMLAAAYFDELFPTACEEIGIFRSTNRGATWTNVLSGSALAIASDPNDPDRFYATLDMTGECSSYLLPPYGVYKSIDQGDTWTATPDVPGAPSISEGDLNNAELRVSKDQSRVWSAILKNGNVNSIAYSDDFGGSWTIMDEILTKLPNGTNSGLHPREKPGGQGAIHFALLASPDNKDEVIVGGDRQDLCCGIPLIDATNAIGAENYSGRLFRGDAGVMATGDIPSPQWEHMTHSNAVMDIPGGGTASSSAPHADCRDMEFRADGSILESNDGGITVRTSPSDNTGDWFGLCGNMQVFESHGVAYEPILKTILFGNQDVANIAGTLGVEGSFATISSGDGNAVMIDYKSDPDFIYHYYAAQRFTFPRRMKISKTTGMEEEVLELDLSTFQGSFLSVVAMNPVNQKVFVVAGSDRFDQDEILLTRDRAESFTFHPSGLISFRISAMAWTVDGSQLYVFGSLAVFGLTEVAPCELLIDNLVCARGGEIGEGNVRRAAIAPSSNNIIFAVITEDSYPRFLNPSVKRSVDGGSTWADVTGTGSLIDTAAVGGAIVFIDTDEEEIVLVGTSNGVVRAQGSLTAITGWTLIAEGLPTVLVTDMVYNKEDDILLISTMGRGIFYLEDASMIAGGFGIGRRLGQWRSMEKQTTRGLDGSDRVMVDFKSWQVPSTQWLPPEPYVIGPKMTPEEKLKMLVPR